MGFWRWVRGVIWGRRVSITWEPLDISVAEMSSSRRQFAIMAGNRAVRRGL